MTKCAILRGFRGLFLVSCSVLVLGACKSSLPPSCEVPQARSEEIVRAKESGEVQLDFETISALLFDG
ncbi:MAG: hypothetical protein RJB38_1255, partial [Pseudomonadota bacterium]